MTPFFSTGSLTRLPADQGLPITYVEEGEMRVKTKVKSGTIVDRAKTVANSAAGTLKKGWDKLPNWLTWPW